MAASGAVIGNFVIPGYGAGAGAISGGAGGLIASIFADNPADTAVEGVVAGVTGPVIDKGVRVGQKALQGWLAKPGQSCPVPAPGVAPTRQSLLGELTQQGVRHTPENVVAIARDASGRVVFLETGNARAGLQHIVQEHAAQFAQQGIPQAQIPDAVMAAVTRGRQVGMQGTRPIFEVEFNGQTHRIAVTVGDNGFIVGANPAGH